MVSVKLDAAGEEFWSDEAVTSFTTDPEPGGEDIAVDATCEHRRVPITPEVMLVDIDRFRSKMREEQKKLKERIKAGEEFWSDEAVTSFRTEPEPGDEDNAVDATCEHRRVKITPEVMLVDIDRFRSKMREEQKLLKDVIKSLKSKVEKILSHLDYTGIYTMTKDFISSLIT
ncbi:hypothetical protein MSG28_015043 [Choristoneura fumiferana]|uniref:Uncharacterized protein n=1 Tax=Choristoneura fumiferana TaxID=7141 RepID=A0ACC0KYM8_CHOFU|nr:hypothetical protein MSG28_015043 [Choristoneura fumiferana]